MTILTPNPVVPSFSKILTDIERRTECPLNIETPSYHYRDSHYKDKTVSRPSYLYDGNLIHVPGNAVFISRRTPGVLSLMPYWSIALRIKLIYGNIQNIIYIILYSTQSTTTCLHVDELVQKRRNSSVNTMSHKQIGTNSNAPYLWRSNLKPRFGSRWGTKELEKQ